VRTNLLGTVLPAQAAVPEMKRRSASAPCLPRAIVTLGSLRGLVRSTIRCHYRHVYRIRCPFPVSMALYPSL